MSGYVDKIISDAVHTREAKVLEIGRLIEEIAEIDNVIVSLGGTPPTASESFRPVIAPATAETPPRKSRRGRPKSNTPWQERVRGGRTLAEWVGMIRREFGDGREFTALEFAAISGGYGAPNVETARQTLEVLLKVGQLLRSGSKGQRVKYWLRGCEGDPLNGVVDQASAGVRDLSSAQRAWDRQRDGDREPISHGRPSSAPVPGTGRSRALAAIPSDIRKVVEPALRAGWEPSLMGNGHVRFTHPGKPLPFTVPSSPSDVRTIKNLKASMQRVGAPI